MRRRAGALAAATHCRGAEAAAAALPHALVAAWAAAARRLPVAVIAAMAAAQQLGEGDEAALGVAAARAASAAPAEDEATGMTRHFKAAAS